MAGDWMKFETSTFDKPEVLQMSYQLQIPDTQVVGCLLKVWRWFDLHTEFGNAHVTLMYHIDTLAGVTGFSEGMKNVGWLAVDGDKIYLPNFDRHNGNSAKKRALTAKRVASHRRNADVTPNALPREEKRRDKKENYKKKVRNTKFVKPTLSEVTEFVAEKGYHIDPERFIASNEAKGWVIGKFRTPMKSWKHALATWEKNHEKDQRVQHKPGSVDEQSALYERLAQSAHDDGF